MAEASAAKAGKTGTKEKGEKAKPKAKPKVCQGHLGLIRHPLSESHH